MVYFKAGILAGTHFSILKIRIFLVGINFSDFDTTATIMEALRSDDDTDTESGRETTTGISSDTVDH